jgi:hypothetical protein
MVYEVKTADSRAAAIRMHGVDLHDASDPATQEWRRIYMEEEYGAVAPQVCQEPYSKQG